MICIKHPRVTKSSFPVMVNVALQSVCACIDEVEGKGEVVLALGGTTWPQVHDYYSFQSGLTGKCCTPQEVAFAWMGKHAQHSVIPCNQRPLNKQLLLKTYNHKLLLTIRHC